MTGFPPAAKNLTQSPDQNEIKPPLVTVGCKRAVRNQDFGFHFTFRPQVFFRPQILALSPLKESQQRRNQDHSKALALKIEIDMPYALVEPREVYPRGK